MPALVPELRISTPTEPVQPGRGFYQLEEDALYVQVGAFTPERRFFSYLESETTRLDLDRNGRLIFIEVATPRRHWPVDKSLTVPTNGEPADIRWLDFRQHISAPKLVTNKRRTVLKLAFSSDPAVFALRVAQNVALEVNRNRRLHSIWISDIIDDLAGQEIAAFRRGLRE